MDLTLLFQAGVQLHRQQRVNKARCALRRAKSCLSRLPRPIYAIYLRIYGVSHIFRLRRALPGN